MKIHCIDHQKEIDLAQQNVCAIIAMSFFEKKYLKVNYARVFTDNYQNSYVFEIITKEEKYLNEQIKKLKLLRLECLLTEDEDKHHSHFFDQKEINERFIKNNGKLKKEEIFVLPTEIIYANSTLKLTQGSVFLKNIKQISYKNIKEVENALKQSPLFYQNTSQPLSGKQQENLLVNVDYLQTDKLVSKTDTFGREYTQIKIVINSFGNAHKNFNIYHSINDLKQEIETLKKKKVILNEL